jgi:hypothetical protein
MVTVMSQSQHSIQKAYYKSFRDGDRIWVYPKLGGQAFRKPISWCTAEIDFQSEPLEKAQDKLIENRGIKYIWHLLKPGRVPPDQYEALLRWLALHLTRNQKARGVFFPTNQDYEREFPVEFTRQLLGLRSSYTVADVYTCDSRKFLITSDNPVLEFDVERGGKSLLILPIAPSKFVQLSSDGRRWHHEERSVEELVNAMIWASAFKYVFSHRGDFNITTSKENAESFNIVPVFETQSFQLLP